MRTSSNGTLLVSLALSITTAACGTSAPPSRGGGAGASGSDGSGGSVDTTGCVALQLETLEARSVPGWVSAKASGEDLGDAVLRIELNDRPGHPLTEGSYDLSAPPDDDYATCARCVVLMEGSEQDPASADRLFFQAGGSLEVESAPTPPSHAWAGSVAGVKLVEVQLDPSTYEVTPVSDGICYVLGEASWDTNVALGAACATAADCGDAATRVCDPATATCVEAACDGVDRLCPGGQVCLVQSFEASVGACYDACDPTVSGSCGTDRTCRVVHFDQQQGVCVQAGQAEQGQACEPSEVATGCERDLVCAAEFTGHVCREKCDFWASTAACPTAQMCVVGSFCSDGAVDPAPVDGFCDTAAPEANPCGMEAGIARGVCVLESDASGTAVMCRRVCRMSASDCSGDQVCQDYFGTVGVCRPMQPN